ncbi:MAG: chloride channel protein family, partial [Bryobacterales bacterium]|nr:chloride channel protein family [Bryobacterales bacterium]
VSASLQPEPIYEALAHQEGIHLPGAEAREHISRTLVVSVMRDLHIPLGASIEDALRMCKDNDLNAVPVTKSTRVVGILNTGKLKRAASAGAVTVAELASDGVPELLHLHPDQPLSLALEQMGAAGVDALPVVSRESARGYLGTATLTDVLQAYGIERIGVGHE